MVSPILITVVMVSNSKFSRDILYELASVGELPLPQPNLVSQGSKRERDSDQPIGARTPTTPTDVPPKGNRLVHKLPGSSRNVTNSSNGHLTPNAQQRPQQTPTPPQHHPKPSAQLADPMPYSQPVNVMPNSQGMIQLDWRQFIAPQPVPVTNANFGPPVETPHPGQPYPGFQQGFNGIFSSNPGVNMYHGAYGQQHQDVPLQPMFNHPNPGVDIGNIWESAPPSFEYVPEG
jgi:hypothetical protein